MLEPFRSLVGSDLETGKVVMDGAGMTVTARFESGAQPVRAAVTDGAGDCLVGNFPIWGPPMWTPTDRALGGIWVRLGAQR